MCDNCKDKKQIKEIKEIEVTKEEKAQPIAMQIIKEKVNTIKILAIIIVIQSGMMAAVAWKSIDFISGYTFDSQVTVQADGDSSAIYQDGKGNTLNVGKGESKKNSETKD